MTVISKQIHKENNAHNIEKNSVANLIVDDGYHKAAPTPKYVSRFRSEVVRSRTMSTVWSLQPSVGSWLSASPRPHVETTVPDQAETSPDSLKLGVGAYSAIAPPVGEALYAQATEPVVVRSIAPPVGAVTANRADPVISPAVFQNSSDPLKEMEYELPGLELSPNSMCEAATDPNPSSMESRLPHTAMQHDDDAMFRSHALQEHISATDAEATKSLIGPAQTLGIAPPSGIAPPCGIAPPPGIVPSCGNTPMMSIAPPLGIAPPCGIAPSAGL